MTRASAWQRSAQAGRRANKAEKRVNGKTVKPCRCSEQFIFVQVRAAAYSFYVDFPSRARLKNSIHSIYPSFPLSVAAGDI